MKVLGLIASPSDPSSRFRILQYRNHLHHIELETKYFLPTKDSSPAPWTQKLKEIVGINEWRTWNIVQDLGRLPLLIHQYDYDLIWQSRLLLPYMIQADRAITRPVVLDLDDAVWMLEGAARTARAMEKATTIFAGNEYIANWASRYNKNIEYIPTTVDTKLMTPLDLGQDAFTIGWIGTPSNFKYLEQVVAPVMNFLAAHNDAAFVVVSNERPSFFQFDEKQVRFKQWQAEKENELVNSFSVGIMPLADDEWTRGKCGFKLLQYMSCGKAIIASPVGVNQKYLAAGTGLPASNETEWQKAFNELYQDRSKCAELGLAGRQFVVNNYDTRAWAKIISEKFLALHK